MNGIINFIIGSLGGVASVITILQFFGFELSQLKSRKSKMIIFIFVVISTITLLSYWYHIENETRKNNIENVKYDMLRNDANDTSSAIKISGRENLGDYIGYLTQIVGFYRRHQDAYLLEYEKYNKQLDVYIDFSKDKLDKNENVYPSQWENLKGLVTSGRDHLKKISSSTE